MESLIGLVLFLIIFLSPFYLIYSFFKRSKKAKQVKQSQNNLALNYEAKLREYEEKQKEISLKIVERFFLAIEKLEKAKLTPNNYSSVKKRMDSHLNFLKEHGFAFNEKTIYKDLKEAYKAVLRKDYEKKEQQRVKAQIREEKAMEAQIQKDIKQAEREKAMVEKALEAALKVSKGEHTAEIEALKLKLKDAEDKNQRALSQAQLTRSGYVYIISNIGSFGEGVYKVGMTRRLEPMDRVKELGDASVPFEFDVHAMISSDDAPKLEKEIHRKLYLKRVNKINLRKEFFTVSLEEIIQIVESLHGKVEYVATSAALDYRQGIEMTDKDFIDLHKIDEKYQLDMAG